MAAVTGAASVAVALRLLSMPRVPTPSFAAISFEQEDELTFTSAQARAHSASFCLTSASSARIRAVSFASPLCVAQLPARALDSSSYSSRLVSFSRRVVFSFSAPSCAARFDPSNRAWLSCFLSASHLRETHLLQLVPLPLYARVLLLGLFALLSLVVGTPPQLHERRLLFPHLAF